MNRNILSIAVIFGLLFWSCSKIETENHDLKNSLSNNIASVNSALNTISATKAYEFLIAIDDEKKSTEIYNDSITLEMVAGIYDYKPDTRYWRNFFIPYRLFKKTGTSEYMIVNMPEKLVFRPRHLHHCNPADTVLMNNFTVKATDYQYLYTWFNKHEYLLNAGFTLDSVEMGALRVMSSASLENGRSYSSKYTFTQGYNINVSFSSGGDTTQSSFALMDGDDILLKESTLFIRQESRKRERQYILTIGNIDVKRSSEIDSIQVFLDGVLQDQAAVKITDSTENNGSICHHRDIQITFNDGTVVKLSELIQPARTTLKSLVSAMHEMRFAKNIVDYIAISIYHHSKY